MSILTLTEEQTLLKDSADRYLADRYGFEHYRSLVANGSACSSKHWQEFADMGWLAMVVPEEHDGLGASLADVLVLCESLGRGLVIEPFLSTTICSYALQWAEPDGARGNILTRLAAGQWKGAWAAYEQPGRNNVDWIETTATASESGFELNGTKHAVLSASAADDFIVAARTGGARDQRDGISLFLVPADAPGLALRTYETVHGFQAGDLTLSGAMLPESALLGASGEAGPLLHAVADLGGALLCADAAGCLQQLNVITQEYLRTREQFGQPLGQFQALQHRVADMYISEQRCLSLLTQLRAGLAHTTRPDPKLVSACKYQAAESGRYIGQNAVQLHGGIGVTEELVLGHYFKRVTALDSQFGDSNFHLDRFADLALNNN